MRQPSSCCNNNRAGLICLHVLQCCFSAGLQHRHLVTHVCHADGSANGLCHVRENAWCLFPLFPCWGYWSMFNSPIMPESISRPIHNHHAGAQQWWRVSQPTWLFKPIHSIWNPVKTHLFPFHCLYLMCSPSCPKPTSAIIDQRGREFELPCDTIKEPTAGAGPSC